MSLLSLAVSPFIDASSDPALALIAPYMAIFAIFILVLILVGIGLYIYTSFAYMAIARKARYAYPGIAWIPGVGPLIITNRIAKMHWWPFLLFIGIIIPIINMIVSVIIMVFSIIWLWKTFEAIKKPGWWAIINPLLGIFSGILLVAGIFAGILGIAIGISIIFIGIGLYVANLIIYLIIMGIAAWSK